MNKVTPLKVWIMGHTGRVGKLLVESLATDSEGSGSVQLHGGHSSTEILKALNGKPAATSPFSENDLRDQLAEADIIIDFSSPKSSTDFLAVLKALAKTRAGSSLEGVHYLCATTGFESLDFFIKSLETICVENKLTALYAPNTSLGILTLRQILRTYSNKLAHLGFDIEIVETHHRRKKDAPSGTALTLAESIVSANPSLQVKSDLLTRGNQLRGEGEINISSIRGGGVFGEHEVRFISESEEINFSHRALNRDVFAKGAMRLGRWLAGSAIKKGKYYALEDAMDKLP